MKLNDAQTCGKAMYETPIVIHGIVAKQYIKRSISHGFFYEKLIDFKNTFPDMNFLKLC